MKSLVRIDFVPAEYVKVTANVVCYGDDVYEMGDHGPLLYCTTWFSPRSGQLWDLMMTATEKATRKYLWNFVPEQAAEE